MGTTTPRRSTTGRTIAIALGAVAAVVVAISAALDDPAVAAVVQQHSTEAQQLGVTGTPTFVIGSQVLNGAQPIAAFDEVIAAEAAAAAAR